jgi:hypothetical protein
VADAARLVPPAVPLVVQVNGIKRAVVQVPAPPADAAVGSSVEAAGLARAAAAQWLSQGRVRRVVTAGRIINFVMEP